MLERELVSSPLFYQEFKPLWVQEKAGFRFQIHIAQLVDNYPPFVNGRLKYFIDGGAATFIHVHQDSGTRTTNGQLLRHEPPDVDVVIVDDDQEKAEEEYQQMSKDLVGLPQYDLRDLSFWLGGRGLPVSDKIRERVKRHVVMKTIMGRDVPILNKPALSVAKLAVFKDYKTGERLPPREKDIKDVLLMGVPRDEIRKTFDYFGGASGGIYIPQGLAT